MKPICLSLLVLTGTLLSARGEDFHSLTLPTAAAAGREIHVAVTGDDAGPGTAARPYRTIGRGAAEAQSGDRVIVHGGTYREWIKPLRGGTSEERRITYRAATGESVFVKGSERIVDWQPQGGGVWRAELPNAFFGTYNPYELPLSGGWLNYGQWHHRGDVYLNGEACREQQNPGDVATTPQSWHCRVADGRTTILANFRDADPNRELAEINVREMIFMPEITGLQYITVRGFQFAHAAANWAPPVLDLQTGAVGTRMGRHWIIEHCSVTNARCVGIILGHAPGVNYADIDTFGDHVVRNNHIRRCGQAGIAGQKGATRSLIEGNLIEETNYRREFGGWETAAIKFHNTVDATIRHNLIRGVYHQQQGAYGIWIDYANQGLRITGNLIYDTQTAAIFLEMNHGGMLIDNNVLLGGGLEGQSDGNVFAHNLFVDCGYRHHPDLQRKSAWYFPHTTRQVGTDYGVPADERWYNNVFVGRGLDFVKANSGNRADHNLFLAGAKRSSFGDEHSVGSAVGIDLMREESRTGVVIRYTLPAAVSQLRCPVVDAALVGIFQRVGQFIEDRDGQPITIDIDISGAKRIATVAGPLAEAVAGRNVIEWVLASEQQ
jgi:Right handed beta helix region